MIKQTYSAWVNTGGGPKKWHMSTHQVFIMSEVYLVLTYTTSPLDAYYTEDSLEELHTVDEVPALSGLNVPHECYQRARSTTTSGGKARDRNSQRDSAQVDGPRTHSPRRNSTASADSHASDREGFASFSQHKFAAFSVTPAPHIPQTASAHQPHRNSVSSSGKSGSSRVHAGVLPMEQLSSSRSPRIAPSPALFHIPSRSPALSIGVTSLRNTAQPPLHSPSTPSTASPLSVQPSPSYDYPNSPIAPSPLASNPALDRNANWHAIDSSCHSAQHRQLVPLDRLASMQISRRDPVDDEALRSFRPL